MTTSRLAEVVLDITEEGRDSTNDSCLSDDVTNIQHFDGGLSDDDFMMSDIGKMSLTYFPL